jgi:hypothetical protein
LNSDNEQDKNANGSHNNKSNLSTLIMMMNDERESLDSE